MAHVATTIGMPHRRGSVGTTNDASINAIRMCSGRSKTISENQCQRSVKNLGLIE